MNPCIIAVAALLAAPAARSGAAEPTRDQLVERAVDRYAKKDYEGAIKAFERAYRVAHQAVDLYNIGRVYEDLGEPDKARRFYERFLARDDLTQSERAEGQRRLASLGTPPPIEPTQVQQKPAPTADEDAKPRRRERRAGARDRVQPGARWAVITGSTLIPIGVASLVSGTVLATTAVRNADNGRNSADEETPFEETRHYAIARRQAIAADVLLIGGGIVAATGVLMIAAGYDHKGRRARKKSKRKRDVAVSPMGAGMQVRVRF